MAKTNILGILLLAGLIMGPADVSLACKAAGPNKHVGNITAINDTGGEFTILDAETGKPMTFQATPKILKDLQVEARVMVSYKEEEDKLIAVEVHS